MDNELIVKSIKDLCKKNNITANQLEIEAGFSQGLISRWLKTTPSLDKIIDIADYFHVSLDEVVGRNNDINDAFLKALCNQTENNMLVWESIKSNHDANINMYKSNEFYDEDVYHEINYFTKFNDGYIIIWCFCKYNHSLAPNNLSLYIQVDDESSTVYQNYSMEQLMPLWIKILKQLSDEAPDDIKAEDLKQQLINNNQVLNIEYTTNKYLAENNIKNFFETINTPEIKQLISVFSNPKMVQTMKTTQRLMCYFNNINANNDKTAKTSKKSVDEKNHDKRAGD